MWFGGFGVVFRGFSFANAGDWLAMRRLCGWFSLYFMFCSQVFIGECGGCGWRCGESAVQSAELVVN